MKITPKRIASISSVQKKNLNKNTDFIDGNIVIENDTKEKIKIFQEIAMITVGSITSDDNSNVLETIQTKGNSGNLYIMDTEEDEDEGIDTADYDTGYSAVDISQQDEDKSIQATDTIKGINTKNGH